MRLAAERQDCHMHEMKLAPNGRGQVGAKSQAGSIECQSRATMGATTLLEKMRSRQPGH
jgi:hypothetical protein